MTPRDTLTSPDSTLAFVNAVSRIPWPVWAIWLLTSTASDVRSVGGFVFGRDRAAMAQDSLQSAQILELKKSTTELAETMQGLIRVKCVDLMLNRTLTAEERTALLRELRCPVESVLFPRAVRPSASGAGPPRPMR